MPLLGSTATKYTTKRHACELASVIKTTALLFLVLLTLKNIMHVYNARPMMYVDRDVTASLMIGRPTLFQKETIFHLRLALVINLKRRHDRWRRIALHLSGEPILQRYSIERIEGVDGHKSLNVAQMVVDGHLRQRAFESVMANGRRVWGQEMTAGALGCLLSHAQAWERAVNLNESILVFEDDVELISPAFEELYPRALRQLPTNFGLLYLADMAKDTLTIRKTDYSSALKRISRPLWGTYAYVVSPSSARRLLLHMYPADVQVDSYIKQVAELYGADMPNFVVSRDVVYTDNSESRDSDAQMQGGIDDPLSVEDVYHVLLPSSDSALQAESFTLLKFDSSYSSTSAATPGVCYHTEASAIAYAAELGLLKHGLIGTDATNAAESSRWLLCLAIALRHGGLCFTEPFIVVRSIHHLLHGVSIGIFMDSQSIKDGTPSFAQVVYVSPSSTAVPTLRDVVDGVMSAAVAANSACALTMCVEHMRAILSNNDVVTIFPSHVYAPLLPLQRPCHCDDQHQRMDLAACKSRCERMVAPPYAAGYPARMHLPVETLQAPLPLHVRGPKPGYSIDACWQTNINRLKTLHTPPIWEVHLLENSNHQSQDVWSRPFAVMHDFCAGISAVEEYGGAYVDVRGNAPRRSLFHGVLTNWSDVVSKSSGLDAKEFRVRPVVLWSNIDKTQLSWRFFAAPSAHHPVATRLLHACNRMRRILRMSEEWGRSSAPDPATVWHQLREALADDACSIEFWDEKHVFG